MSIESLTIRDLRRLWKPHKDRLNSQQASHPTAIRFHRACSWLAEAEQLIARQEWDSALIHQWIGFNSLYSQWDAVRQEPMPDWQTWTDFLSRIVKLDLGNRFADLLQNQKPNFLKLLENGYLTKHFWRDPQAANPPRTCRGAHKVYSYYLEGKWHLILEEVLERVYLLRCQLVHGAASLKSNLNRSALTQCVVIMDIFLKHVLHVWVEHASVHDWGRLCYPPIDGNTTIAWSKSWRSVTKQ